MNDSSQFLATPRVVATVHRPQDLQALASRPADDTICDLLEFRLDNLREHLDEVETVVRSTQVPCLMTARHSDEGGAGFLDEATRESLLRRFLPMAQLIDIEIRSLPAMADLVNDARNAGVGVIASCHDFQKTLPLSDLESAIVATQAGFADVVKIAMTLNSMSDMTILLLLTEATVASGQKISSMGMGRLGKVSRLALAAAGSCLNYGFLHEPNAPGQWPAAELKRLIGELLPQ
ncbi:MAG: type I 3-dehydroquinate dehydratase [Verrucomicrobiae bacterium]|nr:type I 3-dehydroquinate dehydratase [Verrucomicrobiae bacterium]